MPLDSNNYPIRHLSVRVPWHDNQWNGTVCSEPSMNDSCLVLKSIAPKRDDVHENSICGAKIPAIAENDWPPCVHERACFMMETLFTRTLAHDYTRYNNPQYSHLRPTPFEHPPFSAPSIPFRWMLLKNMDEFNEQYRLGLDATREPKLSFKSNWIQDARNQKPLLDCFFNHVKPETSLVFFYAKRIPLVEDNRSIIVGVGRITGIGKGKEYDRSSTKGIHCMIWERSILHSIRPDLQDGFLMPYHLAIEHAQENPSFDISDVVAFTLDDNWEEFSYANEHVTNDGAIGSLLSCMAALTKAKELLAGDWDRCIRWINDRLGELWTMRGPCPGLGPVLCAFGVELGTFVAREIERIVGDNEDPWPMVNLVFNNPNEHLSKQMAQQIGQMQQGMWKHINEKTPERLALMKLLSRFQLTPDQTKMLLVKEEREDEGIDCTDTELINNPYLIYELTRYSTIPVSIFVVDRGIFPDSRVRDKHPLPAPSHIDSPINEKRIRAFTTYILDNEAKSGNSLQSRNYLIDQLRSMDLIPPCEVTQDSYDVAEGFFIGYIQRVEMHDKSPAYQLSELSEMGEKIRRTVTRRLDTSSIEIDADWRTKLDEFFPGQSYEDKEEEQARIEKTDCLNVLATSRLSVLIGSAGTGKTTLLSVLCSHEEIARGGVLLLAPTGKARVKMEQTISSKAFTLAQFLGKSDRFDYKTQRYQLSDKPPNRNYKTVIIDESSMLTEEMLGALFQSLGGVERYILVGDPRQLPPIGPGRPFVDIIKKLEPENIETIFPRTGKGYGELTISRRQIGQERPDIQLAQWFGGRKIEPGEDEIFHSIFEHSDHIKLLKWDRPDEIQDLLFECLVEELELDGLNDLEGFDISLGAKDTENFHKYDSKSVLKVENWQILTPVRGMQYGVFDINRNIHKSFRSEIIAHAWGRGSKIPRPIGNEEIVYGDKIINVMNHPHEASTWGYSRYDGYIANGEVGLAIGPVKTDYYDHKRKREYQKLRVSFSSQPDSVFEFDRYEFGDDANPRIELAYALTVHKAQGSEFGLVFLVIPNPCWLLSKEMLYTALTRQRDRIILLHQGDFFDIKSYSSDSYSETASRMTNLFHAPKPVEIDNRFLEDNLIHRTLKDDLVRSKSELIIADLLFKNGVEYEYEAKLVLNGVIKYPDFTIEDDDLGITYYWEHCGMLHSPGYLRRWEAKLQWYKEQDILPLEDGGGKNGTLIITKESPQGGISSPDIEAIIKKIASSP